MVSGKLQQIVEGLAPNNNKYRNGSGKQQQIVEPSPWRCCGASHRVCCFSEKMMSLDVLDMHFVSVNDFNQYLI